MRSCFGLGMASRRGRGRLKAFICTRVQEALVGAQETCAEDESIAKALDYPKCYVMYFVYNFVVEKRSVFEPNLKRALGECCSG